MRTKTKLATLAFVFLLGFLAIAFRPLAKAHTEADPFVTDLIGGQTMDVGDVHVWNDADYLYVRYMTDGDWAMGRTHLHVATSVDDIPQTRRGLPIPGRFDYVEMHDPYATDLTYAIPLTWSVGDDLYIAAHADVCGPGASPMPAEGVLATVPLYSWPEANIVGSVTVSVVGMNLVVTFETVGGWEMLDTHVYVDPNSAPAYPPSWGEFPYSHTGLGRVTSDTYVFPLADLGVGCNDMLYLSTHATVIYYYDEWRWVKRDAWGDENPFDGWTKFFSVTIPCQMVCETAWANGLRFVENNWAMYFTYTVQ